MELTDIDLNQLALFRQLMIERFVSKVAATLGLTHPAVSNPLASITATTLRDDMASGKVELAIGPLPHLKAGFFRRRLFKPRYVCLFRRGHALDCKHFTVADFTAAEHLAIISAGTGHS